MADFPRRWSIGGADPDTPVTYMGDAMRFGRSALVMFDDDERATLEWVLKQAEARRELLMIRDTRRRWSDHWLTRVGGVGAALVVVTNLVLNIVFLFHGGR